MPGAAAQVTTHFSNARSYASSAITSANAFITALNSSIAGLEMPPMDFDVKPFRMARYPVTWALYDAFLMAEDGFGNPASWSDLDRWGHHRQPSERRWGFNSYLAVNVSWFDAMAYGRWLGSRPGLPVSHPRNGNGSGLRPDPRVGPTHGATDRSYAPTPRNPVLAARWRSVCIPRCARGSMVAEEMISVATSRSGA